MAGLCALATASLAAAASDALKCHPDLRGTRSLTINGDVTSYGFIGGRVAVHWLRAPGCTGTAVWNYAKAPRAEASSSCQRSAEASADATATHLVAAQGNRIVRVALSSSLPDRPDRLDVLDRTTHRRLASWPLFERPARVALYGDIAILAAAKRHALDALRISDGHIAMLGIARAGDRPVIGSQGVLYQDDLDLAMHRAAPHRVTLKLLPLSTVRRELAARGARQIGTSRINAISMDGKRVAFAVHDPEGKCDKVLFWSIPWHFVSRLTQRVGPTCLPTHEAGGITDVAIAGDRAVWTTRYGADTRVLTASIINCVEWVVTRPVTGARVADLSGDREVLAVALAGKGASNVGLVPAGWRSLELAHTNSRITAISADQRRVAVLDADGTIRIVTRAGRVTRHFFVGEAHTIALQHKMLAVLHSRNVDVYRLGSTRPVRTWSVPSSASSIDLQYGIVLVTAGRDVLALNTATGHAARLLSAPGKVAAQIEEPGAAVQFNVGGRGYLRFLPMSVIEARTS